MKFNAYIILTFSAISAISSKNFNRSKSFFVYH